MNIITTISSGDYKYDKNGPYTEKEYDNAGQIVRETVFEANGTMLQDIHREYDVLGNLTMEQVVKDPNYPSKTDDLFTFYNYDIAGNLKTVIQPCVGNSDPNGVIPDPNNDLFTEYIYDGLNRRIGTIDPEGIRTSVVYSPGGLVLQIIDPNSNDPNILFLTQNSYDPTAVLKRLLIRWAIIRSIPTTA